MPVRVRVKFSPDVFSLLIPYLEEPTALTWRRFSNVAANGATLLLVTNEAYYSARFCIAKAARIRREARSVTVSCLEAPYVVGRLCSRVMFLAGLYVPVNNCGAPDELTMEP